MTRMTDSFTMEGAAPAVKFCGLSHLSDVAAMNELGPDFVGLVFWPKSKRVVDATQALALREALDDSIRTVGVFVDESIEAVVALFEQGIISVAQLHGSEDDAYVTELRERTGDGMEIWKAFEVRDASDIDRANASSADLVLLDGGKGEGNAFPWELLEGMTCPYALAGGLTPDNITDALSLSRPILVDVSSGIECPPICAEREGGPRAGSPSGHSLASLSQRKKQDVQWTFPPSEPLLEHGSPSLSAPHKDPDAMAAFIKHVRG